jgi:hypothetical protein
MSTKEKSKTGLKWPDATVCAIQQFLKSGCRMIPREKTRILP